MLVPTCLTKHAGCEVERDDHGASITAFQLARHAARTGAKVHINLPDVDLGMDRERATALFRILQETF